MTGRLTRRNVARAAAGLVAAAAGAPAAFADGASMEAPTMNAATYRFRVGDIAATVISDGQIAFPAWPTYAPGATEAEVAAAMRRRGLAPPDYLLDANVLLLETAGRRVLIDAGWGAFAPQVGRTLERLRALGVAPETIDLVMLSHIHPDHVGGLVDADGSAAFPNAEVAVAAVELDQWRRADFGAMRIDAGFRPLFERAARIVLDLGDRLTAVAADAEVAPGVRLVPLPGHTLGHAGVEIASGSQALLCAADAFHDQAFDLDNPDWSTAFDHDPALAAETRRRLLDRAAADGAFLMAYHMPFPAIGRVEVAGAGWLWAPERWRLAAAAGSE